MNSRRSAGLTWIEMVIALGIVMAIFLVCWVAMSKWIIVNQMTAHLSNLKQLHLATQSMALDGRTTGDETLGWPGDIGGTFTNWARKVVPDYLDTNNFRQLLSAPGKPVRAMPNSVADTAILIYAVSSNSPSDTVFLSTANFTNSPTGGLPLRRTAVPFGNVGFVVFRKEGDGAILPARKVGDAKAIGSYAPMLK